MPKTAEIKKKIEALFLKKQSVGNSILRIFYSLEPYQNQSKTLDLQWSVGVSAKNIKLAVHRNRIKRLLRASFRPQIPTISPLLSTHKQHLYLFIHYHHSQVIDFKHCQQEMAKLLNSLKLEIEKNFS